MAQTKSADCGNWTTKTKPVRQVKGDTEYSITCRGLEVKATRLSYGSLEISVLGYLNGRRVHVFSSPNHAWTDERLQDEALAFANDLADLGVGAKVSEAVA